MSESLPAAEAYEDAEEGREAPLLAGAAAVGPGGAVGAGEGGKDEAMSLRTGGQRSVELANAAALTVLVVMAVAMIVVASVARKLMYDAYGTRLVFFRQQLTNFLYDVWATAVLAYKLVWRPGDITPRMRRFPMRRLAFIAFLDSFADFLGSVGGVNTPGSWQTLLQQLLIPAVIVVSYLYLRHRYSGLELFGATLIVAGSALAIVPVLTAGDEASSVRWYSVLLYALSQMPTGGSYVLKEAAFREASLDVFYLTVCVSWMQLFISWLWVPLLGLPGFGGIAMRDIPETLQNGARCLLGEDVAIYRFGKVIGHCSPFVPRITFIFSIAGFLAGILQLLITAKGSAVLTVLTQGLALPLANMAFSVGPIMGSSREAFSWWDVGGLLCVVVGFIIYRLRHYEEKRRTAAGVVNYGAASEVPVRYGLLGEAADGEGAADDVNKSV